MLKNLLAPVSTINGKLRDPVEAGTIILDLRNERDPTCFSELCLTELAQWTAKLTSARDLVKAYGNALLLAEFV